MFGGDPNIGGSNYWGGGQIIGGGGRTRGSFEAPPPEKKNGEGHCAQLSGGDPKNIWDPFFFGVGGSPFTDTPNSLLGGGSDTPPHFWGALGWGRPPPKSTLGSPPNSHLWGGNCGG